MVNFQTPIKQQISTFLSIKKEKSHAIIKRLVKYQVKSITISLILPLHHIFYDKKQNC